MHEIAKIKPVSPSVSKPWIPWGFCFASTFLVILMMGFGPQSLSRFQQPYNLDATSEMTIELVDTPVIQMLARKSDARTRFGRADTPNRNSGSGFQRNHCLSQLRKQTRPTLQQQQNLNGFRRRDREAFQVLDSFSHLTGTLYAIAKTGLYRLTEKADAWTLVSASGPNREFTSVMAERDDTLYLLTSNELLVSIDDGKTWNSLGARPQGRAVALVITDMAMYLVLQTEVFRSEDVGHRWQPIGEVLRADNVPKQATPISVYRTRSLLTTPFLSEQIEGFSDLPMTGKNCRSRHYMASNRWQLPMIDSTLEQSQVRRMARMPQFSIRPTTAISGPILHRTPTNIQSR